MEIFLWILAFVLMLAVPYLLVKRMGRQALSQYRTEKDAPAVVVPKKKTDEQAEWQQKFLELLQRTCPKHEYDSDRMHDWWKCIHCEAEEEWTYSGGCACRVVHDRSLAGKPTLVLTDRNRFCTLHGRGPAVRAIQNFEKYSKGGRTS